MLVHLVPVGVGTEAGEAQRALAGRHDGNHVDGIKMQEVADDRVSRLVVSGVFLFVALRAEAVVDLLALKVDHLGRVQFGDQAAFAIEAHEVSLQSDLN